jgi:hypothetical protein
MQHNAMHLDATQRAAVLVLYKPAPSSQTRKDTTQSYNESLWLSASLVVVVELESLTPQVTAPTPTLPTTFQTRLTQTCSRATRAHASHNHRLGSPG